MFAFNERMVCVCPIPINFGYRFLLRFWSPLLLPDIPFSLFSLHNIFFGRREWMWRFMTNGIYNTAHHFLVNFRRSVEWEVYNYPVEVA